MEIKYGAKNETGNRYGMLLVLSEGEKKIGSTATFWNCLCDCGNTVIVEGRWLRRGIKKSCSCTKHANLSDSHTKHGDSRMKEYINYYKMIDRCLNELNPGYENYGGRGIKVCNRWLESYENFISDMGYRPSDKHSIDRINNDGNYEQGNCRWATSKEQNNNKRNSFVIINGQEISIPGFCKLPNMNKSIYRYWRYVKKLTPQQIYDKSLIGFEKDISYTKKAIIQLTLDGLFIREWESIKLAANELNIYNGRILDCLKGRKDSCGKYKWQYMKYHPVKEGKKP